MLRSGNRLRFSHANAPPAEPLPHLSSRGTPPRLKSHWIRLQATERFKFGRGTSVLRSRRNHQTAPRRLPQRPETDSGFGRHLSEVVGRGWEGLPRIWHGHLLTNASCRVCVTPTQFVSRPLMSPGARAHERWRNARNLFDWNELQRNGDVVAARTVAGAEGCEAARRT